VAGTLFDAYRQFYGQDSDVENASLFLQERLAARDSVVFLAYDEGDAVGFTQLYPSLSSVSLNRTWILNDLYVEPRARRNGVAKLLIHRAKDHALSTGATKLVLATASDNVLAQRLYEKHGFKKDDFIHYYLSLNVS